MSGGTAVGGSRDLDGRMRDLAAVRRPFVHATVVRAEQPTSARPGDAAVVLEDGSLEGFVGGQCAEGSVRVAALGVLRDGEPLLLRILPGGTDAGFPEAPGAQVVVNPCLSGGALEIFLAPVLPPPLVTVVGATPIADAVVSVASFLGFTVTRDPAGRPPDGTTAVLVCSLGRGEEEAIRAALDAGAGYVGLVASRRRGGTVLAGMGLTEAELARVRTPAGVDIGARTPAEIGLSVMAEVVRAIRVDGLAAAGVPAASAGPAGPAEPRQAVDPVCGMTVVVERGTPHLRIGGQDHWFCCPGCRDAYAASSATPGATATPDEASGHRAGG